MPFPRSSFGDYPFDRDCDRDDHLQSKLNDIVKRHPELAEHLDNFTNRTNQRPHPLADDRDFGSSFGRSLGERFGFPFTREDLDPEEFTDRFYRPEQEYHQSGTSYPQTDYHQGQPISQRRTEGDQSEPSFKTHVPSSQSSESSSQIPEKHKTHIQQSNTIDLGQKQDSVEERNQRSFSAPPSGNTQKGNSAAEDMAHHQAHSETKPTERIIPIQIEGRDTPIIPKSASSAQSRPHQPFCGPDRIFGQRPEQFTQFIHRDPRQFPDSWQDLSEEPTRKQNYQQHSEPQHPPQQHKQQAKTPGKEEHQKEIPIPVQKNIPSEPKASSNQQQPDDQPKPTCQEHKALTPIEQIQIIQKDVSNLMEQVQQFTGKPRDKQYMYLDEMLTRNLIKLDNIDVQGQDIIRSSRKEAIKCIEKAIGILEAKAALNNGEKMDVDQPQKLLDTDEKAEEKQLAKSDSTTGGSACEKMDINSEASEVDQSRKENNANPKESNEKMEEPQTIGDEVKDSVETSISGGTTEKTQLLEGTDNQGNVGEAKKREVNDENKGELNDECPEKTKLEN